MNTSGDAAEQIVRLSLEGVEVAARITGSGAKNLAVLLATILKEEQKTMGKARLTNMIRSGKPLTVFSIQQKDLEQFCKQSKQYGILYCVVKNKYEKDGKELVDVIARQEDAPKINRVVQNFKLASVDISKIMEDPNLTADQKGMIELDAPEARTQSGSRSGPKSERTGNSGEKASQNGKKPSVRKKLNQYAEQEQKTRQNQARDRTQGSRKPKSKTPKSKTQQKNGKSRKRSKSKGKAR